MQLEQVFNENQKFLWGLCYRMTGSTADADDVLQETFVRLMQKPPANTEEPLRPWLVRVAVKFEPRRFAPASQAGVYGSVVARAVRD